MSDTVTMGREAWERIRGSERKTWADWILVGEALIVGRTEAMLQAKANKPAGSKYNRLVGAWLRANGLADINPQERYKAILCVEHRSSIEEWRASVDPSRLRRYSHPNCVWTMWSKATGLGKSPRGKPAKGDGAARIKTFKGNKPVVFDQEAVRRAGLAMKESMSRDWFKLAGIALHAAVRDRGDLLVLLAACAPPTASTDAVFATAQSFPQINLPVR